MVLLDSFGLFDKVVAYVKNKGSNLFTLTTTLRNVVFCSLLQFPCPFVGSHFGHAMSKACQNANNDAKAWHGFVEVNLKDVQNSFQKNITWTKNFGKGKQEWKEPCIITML